MPSWSTACLDWEARIVERRSLIPFDPLFADEAAAALAVFKSLRIADVPGQPTFGEACEPFVFDFVAAIFGSYDAKAARRLITEYLLLISKKNTKSTIAAGILVTALIRNWRPYAELLVLAPTKEIANNVFTPAAAMVRLDPELSGILHVVDNQRLIRHLVTQAEAKVVAADTDIVSGKKAAFVIVEELWLFGKRSNASSMLMEATGGQVSRPEGFTVYLTTHSDEPPAGVYKEKLDLFRDIRDGKIEDPKKLGVLYEWPKAMLESEAYLDPAHFYVTNPNLGRSVHADWIAEKLAEAMRGDGEGKQVFLAKHLNVEIGLRLRRDRWAGADFWEAAAFAPLRALDELLARVEVAVVGADSGGLDDLSGVCVLGRDRRTKVWLYWFRAFAHRKVLEFRKEIAPALLDFERDGDLVFWGDAAIATDVARRLTADGEEEEFVARSGAEVDADVIGIVDICRRVREAGCLPEAHGIGVDPAAIGGLLDALIAAGFVVSDGGAGGDILGIRQGAANMNSAILTLQRKLEAGTAAHGGTRLMDFCVSNAKAEQRGNAVMITKQSAGKAKIDPLIAGFNATKLMERNPVAVPSVDDWIRSYAA